MTVQMMTWVVTGSIPLASAFCWIMMKKSNRQQNNPRSFLHYFWASYLTGLWLFMPALGWLKASGEPLIRVLFGFLLTSVMVRLVIRIYTFFRGGWKKIYGLRHNMIHLAIVMAAMALTFMTAPHGPAWPLILMAMIAISLGADLFLAGNRNLNQVTEPVGSLGKIRLSIVILPQFLVLLVLVHNGFFV